MLAMKLQYAGVPSRLRDAAFTATTRTKMPTHPIYAATAYQRILAAAPPMPADRRAAAAASPITAYDAARRRNARH